MALNGTLCVAFVRSCGLRCQVSQHGPGLVACHGNDQRGIPPRNLTRTPGAETEKTDSRKNTSERFLPVNSLEHESNRRVRDTLGPWRGLLLLLRWESSSTGRADPPGVPLRDSR